VGVVQVVVLVETGDLESRRCVYHQVTGHVAVDAVAVFVAALVGGIQRTYGMVDGIQVQKVTAVRQSKSGVVWIENTFYIHWLHLEPTHLVDDVEEVEELARAVVVVHVPS
jgi:hypothetical protein